MNKKPTLNEKFDVTIIVVAFIIMMAICTGIVMEPDGANKIAGVIYSFITQILGAPILLVVFLGLLICIYVAVSKYGNIRFGNEKPEFSTFSYLSMMICAGFGSGTVYWTFLEVASYMGTPPFGTTAFSPESLDWGTAFNIHHWGPSAWGIYCIASLPVAYAYHVMKNPSLRVSIICKDYVPKKWGFAMSKFVDYIYILSTVFGIAFFVALSAPMITAIVASVLGIETSFGLTVGIVLGVSIIYTISSYVGVEKGMKFISDLGIYLLMIFMAIIILFGDTLFIVNQTLSGIGTYFQNAIVMFLYTDAVREGGFPQNWTVFYWSYWLIYAPFMGTFVARISKGRTLREVIAYMILGGGTGTGLLLAMGNAFSINLDIKGIVPVTEMLNAGNGNQVVVEAVKTLPLSGIVMAMLAICLLLLLATTLDGSSFSLATNAQKVNGEPSKLLRVFWCIALTLIPFALIYVDAPLSTIQTCTLLFSVPIIIIIIIMVRAFLKSLKENFGDLTAAEIVEQSKIKN